MIYLVAICVLLGLAYGDLPARVALRVFREEEPKLLAGIDLIPTHPATWFRPVGAALNRLVTALLFAATPVAVGVHWVVPAYLWFVGVTMTLTLTDLDRKLIPNRILFPSLGIAAVLLAAGSVADGDPDDLGRAALAGAAYFGALLLVALIARGGFGMGDVKLALLLGAFLGYQSWETLWVGGVGAFLLGGAVSILLLIFRIKGRKDAIPFGPYLVVAAYIAVAAGAEIADWYKG